MSLIELGALGEFLGSIAVLATLIYLSVQIRQNTKAMDESRRLALAQTYQIRADALQEMLVRASDSRYIGPIITKLTSAGYPENLRALDTLTTEERGRFRQWQIAQQTHWDNLFFQYEQGFLDEDYYRDCFRERVSRLAPAWTALRITGLRPSFAVEVADILREFPPPVREAEAQEAATPDASQ